MEQAPRRWLTSLIKEAIVADKPLSWQQFKDEFKKAYGPVIDSSSVRESFSKLQQHGPVAGYLAAFEELRAIELPEANKLTVVELEYYFRRGLSTELRTHLLTIQQPNMLYREVANAATLYEAVRNAAGQSRPMQPSSMSSRGQNQSPRFAATMPAQYSTAPTQSGHQAPTTPARHDSAGYGPGPYNRAPTWTHASRYPVPFNRQPPPPFARRIRQVDGQHAGDRWEGRSYRYAPFLEQRRCFGCGQQGHFLAECTVPPQSTN